MVLPEQIAALYPCYRCGNCKRLITKLEILAAWDAAVSAALCPCGGRTIRPTNPKLWEELLLPRVWRTWYTYVLQPWMNA